MTDKTRKALIKILNSNKETFYANDLDINGGTINALTSESLLHKTGRTKEVFIPVGGWDEDIYKKVEACEWSLNKASVRNYADECRVMAMELLEIAELIDSIL